MTRRTNAQIAGLTILGYIVAGLTSLVIFGRASGGDGIAAKLASIAQHESDVGVVVVLGLWLPIKGIAAPVT